MELSNTFLSHFNTLEDPRRTNHYNKRHVLWDIIVITILAVICGADNWVEIEAFGRSKEDWLKSFLELPHGIPSHDTFNRIFTLLNPESFERCFINWVQSLAKQLDDEIIALDGKTVRRSGKPGTHQAIHMVNAWAVKNRLVLGQVKTEAKSNEITAIPELLDMIDVSNSIVTIDAMGCQKKIAQKILDKKADYVLGLKGNQGTLFDEVQDLFVYAQSNDFRRVPHEYFEELDKDHGRLETRRYWLISPNNNQLSSNLRWPGLQGIGIVHAKRDIDGKQSEETRYYLVSFGEDVERFARAARGHWNVEINLHWSLDVSFSEDYCRSRTGHSAENLAILRSIALNLLKQENSKKGGISVKRKRAGWDHHYLRKILAGC